MARYGMAIDTEHCTGCQTCVVACQMEHALRPQVAWTRVDTVEWGRWPDGGRLHLPHGCLHCDEPACVEVCPTGASFAGDGGVSLVDHELCIGCGVCAAACPYGARTINRTDRRFFDAAVPAPYEHGGTPLGTAEKCTLCVERRETGCDPACVRSCPTGVRAFGDLDDPADPIWDFIAETGAEQLAGTATYYAHPTYARDVDVAENIRALRKPAQEAQTSGGLHADHANPAVIAAATVGGATAVGAIALGTVRARSRKAAAEEPRGAGGPEAPKAGRRDV